MTFIVRTTRGPAGELAGSVERVRTGERRAFRRAEAIGAIIAEMLQADGPGGGDLPVAPPGRPGGGAR